MCGIWGCIGKCSQSEANTCTRSLLPRGPESYSVKSFNKDQITFGFTRLAINDLTDAGMQPMSFEGIHWICNGEIYNHKDLQSRFELHMHSGSDCSILGELWHKLNKCPQTFFRALDGVFAIAIYDEKNNIVTFGRDPYGVRPLFMGFTDTCTYFGSEIKALPSTCSFVKAFPPGAWQQINSLTGEEIDSKEYHQVPWLKDMTLSPFTENGLSAACFAIRQSLSLAVKKRVHCTERPIAALLSGGIDSSLIAALVQRELKSEGRGPLETYSIGFEGSPDLKYAKLVAEYIGSKHTEIIVTPDDFFKAIPDVIRDIESYDITSVRASVGNWMVCREIRRRSTAKVIFNGDGSDEVFGSYMYFYRAPSDEEFEGESARLLEDIHYFDVLRSDRCISSHGLEARTPFLDKQFVGVARAVATEWRRPVKGVQVEKWILRKAFEVENILPREVLWRQKEAFSDGVSGVAKSWYEEIQDRIPKDSLSKKIYNYNSPKTDESRYYRDIFDSIYGSPFDEVLPYFWMPKWSGETNDPSARTLSIYSNNQ